MPTNKWPKMPPDRLVFYSPRWQPMIRVAFTPAPAEAAQLRDISRSQRIDMRTLVAWSVELLRRVPPVHLDRVGVVRSALPKE